MAFQSSISTAQGFGVPGEVFTNGPLRTTPYTLVSNTQENKVGCAFTVTEEGVAQVGGDAGVFAGILVNPKHYASHGTTSGTLEPTLVLPDNTIGELLTIGEIVVYLSTAANIGDGVFYNDTTGVLGAGTADVGETQIANAKVTRYTTAAAGLAVISITN